MLTSGSTTVVDLKLCPPKRSHIMANTISPEEEAAIKAAMWAELGAARLDNLPMEDNSRSQGYAYPPGFGPPRAVPVNSRWQQAIESGDFNDDDAAMVSNMDSMLNGQLARSRRSAMIQNRYQNFQPAFSDGQMAKDRNGNIPPRARPRLQGNGGSLGHPNHRGLHAGDGPIDIDATLACKGRRSSPAVHNGQDGANGTGPNHSLSKLTHSPMPAAGPAAPHNLGHTAAPSFSNAALPPPGFVAPQPSAVSPILTGIATKSSAQVASERMEGFQPNPPSSLWNGAAGVVTMSATEAEGLPAQNTQSKVQPNTSMQLADGDTIVLIASVMIESRTFEDRGKHAGILHLIKGRNVSDSTIVLLLNNPIVAEIKHFVSDCTSCITADSRQGAQVLMFRVGEHMNVFYTVFFGSSAKSKPFVVALQDLQSQVRSQFQSTVDTSMNNPSVSVRHQPQAEKEQPDPVKPVIVPKKTVAPESVEERAMINETPVEKIVVKKTIVEENSTQALSTSQSNRLVGVTSPGVTGIIPKVIAIERVASTNIATQTVTPDGNAIPIRSSGSRETHSIEMPREWHDWVTGAAEHLCATAPEGLDDNMISDMIRTACIAAMMNYSLKSPQPNLKKLAKATLRPDRPETRKDVSAKVDLDNSSSVRLGTCEQATEIVMAVSNPPGTHCGMEMVNGSESADPTDKKLRYEVEELVGLRGKFVDPPPWLPEFKEVLRNPNVTPSKAVGVISGVSGLHSVSKKAVVSNQAERTEAIQSAARLVWQLQGHKKRPSSGNSKLAFKSGTAITQTNTSVNDVVDMRFRSKPESNRTSTVVDSDDKGFVSCASTREPNSRVTSPTPRAICFDSKIPKAMVTATHDLTTAITSPKRGLLSSRHNSRRNDLHDIQRFESHHKISQIDEAFGRLTL